MPTCDREFCNRPHPYICPTTLLSGSLQGMSSLHWFTCHQSRHHSLHWQYLLSIHQHITLTVMALPLQSKHSCNASVTESCYKPVVLTTRVCTNNSSHKKSPRTCVCGGTKESSHAATDRTHRHAHQGVHSCTPQLCLQI